MSVIALALLLQAPLQLETITPAQAAKLYGKRVTVRLTISKPPYAWNNQTILGVGSDDEEIERGVHLRGERSDVNEGDTIYDSLDVNRRHFIRTCRRSVRDCSSCQPELPIFQGFSFLKSRSRLDDTVFAFRSLLSPVRAQGL